MNPITLSNQQQVTILSLNRPDALNALTPALLGAMRDALQHIAEDASVRALVITGAGRAFCAGADLREGLPSDGSPERIGAAVDAMLNDYYHPIILSIVSMQKPVIAAVNGIAAGAGMSLALACDMRLMADNAAMSTAFTGIGLSMDAGGSYFLPRLVGTGRALELGYSARKVAAEEALRIGLAEQVLPSEGFADAVVERAQHYAQGATGAYAKLKESIHHAFGHTLDEHLAFEAGLQGRAAQSRDFAEGVAAFREKRRPHFEGK